MVAGPQFQKFKPIYTDEQTECPIYFESNDKCVRIREDVKTVRPPFFMIETRETLGGVWWPAEYFKSIKAAHARFIEILDAREINTKLAVDPKDYFR